MEQMLRFLNSNSGAIQALAAVLTFFATIVLAIITWRYVALTRSIAATADKDLKLKHKEKAAQERRLLLLLTQFQERIKALPYDDTCREQIRWAISWEKYEIESVRTLGAAIGSRSGEAASTISDHLTWIKEQIDLVKSSDPRFGFDWGLFSWDRWRAEISHSQSEITGMSDLIGMDKKGY
jgi:DNA repair exonuclease SbcCD ATPase subunit